MPESEFAALIGFDWATQSHSIALHDLGSDRIEDDTVSSDPAAIHAWVGKLQKRLPEKEIALCVELQQRRPHLSVSSIPVLHIYPLNPLTSSGFRKAFRPSGAKDDRTDARLHLTIWQCTRLQLWLDYDRPGAALELVEFLPESDGSAVAITRPRI